MNHASGSVPHVDVIVVGSGAAGMAAALTLAPLRVALMTKTHTLAGGASPWAQGGVAAAVGSDDNPELHAQDTIIAAAGLADPAIVAAMVADGPRAIGQLIRLGARFDRDALGHLALSREGAHSRSRIVRAGGDSAGAEIVRALSAAVMETRTIDLRTETFLQDLIVEAGRVAGVSAVCPSGAVLSHGARAVVLATGGMGRLFPATTNPREATGDGLAAAARAGARLADLAFVQFHPTALDVARDPMPLITEALRGAGARLVDGRARPLRIPGWERAELAPRDIVACEIAAHLARGERVALDARSLGARRLEDGFPQVIRACLAAGYDPRCDVLPVAPAAHYHMGGVAVDARGRTSVDGLWACGEVSCTGAHGANRLASNSLLEALVYGARVAEDVRGVLGRGAAAAPTPRSGDRFDESTGAPWLPPLRVEIPLRAAVGSGLGVVRDAEGLRATLASLDRLASEADSGEARNMILIGRLIAASALLQEESRGAHRRRDFPGSDPRYARRSARTADELLRAANAAPSPSPRHWRIQTVGSSTHSHPHS
jgi:L-aspartate oxidase